MDVGLGILAVLAAEHAADSEDCWSMDAAAAVRRLAPDIPTADLNCVRAVCSHAKAEHWFRLGDALRAEVEARR